MKDRIDPSLQQRINHYHVVGRLKPKQEMTQPAIYRMKIFAKNEVIAKSRFWFFLKKLKKIKKNNGEILSVNVLKERKKKNIKNFGIWLRYQSRTGTHNMYKEIRDLSQVSAISQLYSEMAGRHRAQSSSIQIIRVVELSASQCKRAAVMEMHNNKIKLPHIRPIKAIKTSKSSPFAPRRPTLFRS